MRLLIAVLFFVFVSAHALPGVAQETGSSTGLPMPRFVSLKSGEANLRSGPGTAYPIRWVYRRKHLPLIIHDEHGHWRAVRDPWGEEGWLHRSLLSGRRTAMVTKDLTPLVRDPGDGSDVLLYAERRIIGTLEFCREGWCRMSIDGRAGWMPDTALYGGVDDLKQHRKKP